MPKCPGYNPTFLFIISLTEKNPVHSFFSRYFYPEHKSSENTQMTLGKGTRKRKREKKRNNPVEFSRLAHTAHITEFPVDLRKQKQAEGRRSSIMSRDNGGRQRSAATAIIVGADSKSSTTQQEVAAPEIHKATVSAH